MVAAVNASGGVNVLNQAVGQDRALFDGIFAMGDVKENILCSDFFECFGCVSKCAAARADVIYDQNVASLDKLRAGQFQSFNISRAPVAVFDAENVFALQKLSVTFRCAFVGITDQ